YFLVSDRVKENIRDAVIRTEILGSDHCPVELHIEL
ncbi:MAG: exodeoxyribonuclease III, partial [Oscillospiraceae bacterium]|nr:exodeoxyribonuclease III [Oscillospiraceae bacterium]